MVGFITERHLQQAEEEFPGIAGFFAALVPKPRTFLDLLLAFQRREDGSQKSARAGDNLGGFRQERLFRRGDSCATAPTAPPP
jgi:hypothetical protein